MPRLIVITGPTASGKSDLAIEVALRYGCHIISADSRQMYRGIPIGTAAPTPEQLAAVPHHFVGNLNLTDYYSAADYETDVLNLLPSLWEQCDTQVMCGGSMMYIDAVTQGIDDLPTISPEVRAKACAIYADGGIQQLRLQLLELDPAYYRQVDLNNHRRLIHAIEICLESGRPYSELRTGAVKQRPFDIDFYALDLPRETLFDRINRRTRAMIDAGLVEEARAVSHLRHLNSLNTVGYKEMWPYLDGNASLDDTITNIARNTRVYAKKQLTWLRRRPDVKFITPNNSPSAASLFDTL